MRKRRVYISLLYLHVYVLIYVQFQSFSQLSHSSSSSSINWSRNIQRISLFFCLSFNSMYIQQFDLFFSLQFAFKLRTDKFPVFICSFFSSSTHMAKLYCLEAQDKIKHGIMIALTLLQQLSDCLTIIITSSATTTTATKLQCTVMRPAAVAHQAVNQHTYYYSL